jgi:transglutaminase-like putative cysteine protease
MKRIGIGGGSLTRAFLIFGLLVGLVGLARADSESWDAIYLGGTKVGHMRTRVEPVKDDQKQLTRIRVNFFLQFKRGKDTSTIEVEYGTIETPEGQVLRLDTRTHASNNTLRVHGDVIAGKMKLKIENGDQMQEQVIDWSPDTFGPYGVEMSLARNPIKPGETRQLKTFIPDYNKIGIAVLTARGLETVGLGGGLNRELLRIDQEISFDGKKSPELNTSFWIEPNGQILKSFTDANGGMITYRTTRDAATRGLGQFDLLKDSITKLARQIPNPEATRAISYKLTMNGINPTEIFPNDRRQTIKPGSDPNTATLDVTTAGPFVGEPGPAQVEPEFLASNPLITSTDPVVIKLARLAVGRETDPWAKARAICTWVGKKVTEKNFETSFAPADEVARTLAGDCTEHAVLTAAMCRAEGIPARVATGLVYAKDLGGFGFHMWNEVYINQRWVAIDAAFDETDVDAVHLKLSDSSLNGVAPFETFLPVSRVYGKLKIEVLEIR